MMFNVYCILAFNNRNPCEKSIKHKATNCSKLDDFDERGKPQLCTLLSLII